MVNKEFIKDLRKTTIKNNLLLEAFKELPESLFMPQVKPPFPVKDTYLEEKIMAIKPRSLVIFKMLESLNIEKGESILCIGIDSPAVLAALSRIYKRVYLVELNDIYAEWALEVLSNTGVENVFIKSGDPRIGWKEKAPFDRILIATEFENIPDALKAQLKIAGRLLIPIGPDWAHIMFQVIERISETEYRTERLRDNFFIPNPKLLPEIESEDFSEEEIISQITSNAIAFKSTEDFPVNDLLNRIGDARVVLIGEASHGTSEFYMARQKITRALIEKKGFNIICAEADWSDAEQIDGYVRNRTLKQEWNPFTRFPQWMWRNKEVLGFIEWLKKYNLSHKNSIGFYGLDLYGMENSINLVIDYLEKRDTSLASLAKERYSCITPYMADHANYGKMVLNKQLLSCELDVLKMLTDLLWNKNKLNHSPEYFYAYQNANVVVDAERYYKAMYYGSAESWNLRDFHMFQTLKSLLSYFKPGAKAVIWAHNSHIGNALATEMYSRGEINIGHLCKEYFGGKSYHIGFGTHEGSVAAAHNWGGKMEVMQVNPSLKNSYENLCYKTLIPSFTLPLKEIVSGNKLRKLLSTPKLERAIGVIYRPETERSSHYFRAVLPSQFDEYIWYNTTSAVTPLTTATLDQKLLENHPFSLIDE
ncbi:protein-L-isoaspartate(D-aspartate) O-methyltransferase [Salegentibacter sp. 24]|uniref:erythromycin esterase family protein n=1 Tax=Salegentibacter sp. 24 TaxID=2183986 RepID=UPI0010619419|nr:erythromycin esterase family protein [Salegentibacter sp. 24]TDN83804.1 protein-L-isoaspartate(D-aspartate) O-methyltransferase [Salegentibacter sp. 24]